MTKPLIRIFYLNDEHFGIEVLSSTLSSDEYDQAMTLVHSFPDAKFSRKEGDVYKLPLHFKNVELIQALPEGSYELTEDAQVVVRHGILQARHADKKAEKKLTYQFDDSLPVIPFDFHTTPFKHQHTGVWAVHGEEYFALFMEMGTGKTKVIVDEIRWCANEASNEGRKSTLTLIVCPRNVRYVWLGDMEENHGELGKHNPPDFDYYATRLSTGVKGCKQLIEGMKSPAKTKIFVINYDSVKSMLETLNMITWDLVILDESQKIKGRNAKRTKAIMGLKEKALRRGILTGTPVVNSILDLYSQCEFLDKGSLGYATFEQFKSAFENFRQLPKDKQAAQWHQLSSLKTALSRFAFVVRKSECLDLPPVTQQTINYSLTPQQVDAYQEMELMFMAQIEAEEQAKKEKALIVDENDSEEVDLEYVDSDDKQSYRTEALSAISKLLRFAQICSGFIKDPEHGEQPIPGGNPKLEALTDLIEGLSVTSRFIIFTRFKYDRRIICETLKEQGIEYGVLDGGTGDREMGNLLNRFNGNPKSDREPVLRCLVCDALVAGEGLTLLGTKEFPCYTVIYYTVDFSLGKRLQSEARVHRTGQEHPVTIYDLVGSGTIEAYTMQRLQEKREIAEEIKNFEGMKKLLRELQLRRDKMLAESAVDA